MSIVVVGSIAFDDVQTAKGGVCDALGGSALYFSAAASLFSPVHLVGVVGEDFPPEELAFLNARGVNTEGLQVVKGGKTFRWSGVYETDMNMRRTTHLALNVFSEFNPVLNAECRKASHVFLANIDRSFLWDDGYPPPQATYPGLMSMRATSRNHGICSAYP